MSLLPAIKLIVSSASVLGNVRKGLKKFIRMIVLWKFMNIPAATSVCLFEDALCKSKRIINFD